MTIRTDKFDFSAPGAIETFQSELNRAASQAGFKATLFGSVAGFPLYANERRAEEDDAIGQVIYLSSGIHGDEPAGPLALLELLRLDALPRRHQYFICPLINPSGLKMGVRENLDGLDLNRDFSTFQSIEIQCLRNWMHSRIESIDLGLLLHEDWEASGFYCYELNSLRRPSPSDSIISAAKNFLSIATESRIDGHRLKDGIISPDNTDNRPESSEGFPEAFYIKNNFDGMNYTLETPSRFPLRARIEAHIAASQAAIQSLP